MTTMGTHSKPVNGTVTNGTLVPFTIPAGPVSGWPQQDDPGQSRTAADRPKRRALLMSAFRRNWWRLVFASVGAVAAVVSYGHIVSLFLSWHASSLDAHLMPVAIDGLIIIGAGAAKGGQKRLGWSAIGPGLAASLYANVMNGLPHGYGAAMGSGWATVALFLATNVMERWKTKPAVRRDGTEATGDTTPAATARDRRDSGDDKTAAVASRLKTEAGRVRASRDTTAAAGPELSVEEEAARDGVSPGAVRKRRERARKAAAGRSTS